ncbi:NAD(P)-binding domain-containing protein [Mycobacteroides abscessus]
MTHFQNSYRASDKGSIAIIGPGRHGTAIGQLFASHGVNVTLYHHNPQKAAAAYESVRAVAGGATITAAPNLAAAIEGQQVIALTTLWDTPQRAVIEELGDMLVGRVLLDVSNPLDITSRGVVRRLPKEGSAGQFVATLLPRGAGHAKAFSNLLTEYITDGADQDPPAVLPFLADSAQTAAVVGALLARTGWLPRLVGDISQSADIEAGGTFNDVYGRYGRSRLDASEFTQRFGPEATFSIPAPEALKKPG